MTDHRDLADAALQALPGHQVVWRVGLRAVHVWDLQRALDEGRIGPRQVLRDLNDLRVIAPHLDAAVRAALTGTEPAT